MKAQSFHAAILLTASFFMCFHSYAQEADSVVYTDGLENVEFQAEDTVASKEKAKKSKEKKVKNRTKSNAFMNQIRSVANIFNLGISTGYGYTQNSHSLEGFAILQPENGGLFIYDNTYFGDNSLAAVYDNWINNPLPITTLDTLNSPITIGPNDFNWNTDSTMISYRGPSHSIPLVATVHVDIDRYRIGAGFGLEFHRVGNFKPTALTDTLQTFVPNFRLATYKRYFIFGGYTVYRSKFYQMVADIQIGRVNRGGKYNKELVSSSLYYNIGFVIEKHLSEYIKAFVRPSVEWKTYNISIPETSLQITHFQPAVFVNFGMTFRLPELRRCPVKQCRIQINHRHGNNEYRSKVHPFFFKYQDPDYGQNYPQLLKYKKKGLRKRNTY